MRYGRFMGFWTQVKTVFWRIVDSYGKVFAAALVVLALGVLVITILKRVVRKTSMKSRQIDNSSVSFITAIVSLVAYVVLFVLMVSTLGFSTEGIIAGLSSVILAVALGLQNTLASLANGILLIFTRPFKAGDFVDIGGTSGTVKEIKLFCVELITTDNLTVTIPNNTVFGSMIINYSRMDLRRLDLLVDVAYGSDVKKVRELLLSCVEEDERVLKNPEPFCRLTEYGDSSLIFTLRAWTQVGDFWNVKFDLLEKVLAVLEENHIEIPYNHLDVHITNEKEDSKC